MQDPHKMWPVQRIAGKPVGLMQELRVQEVLGNISVALQLM